MCYKFKIWDDIICRETGTFNLQDILRNSSFNYNNLFASISLHKKDDEGTEIYSNNILWVVKKDGTKCIAKIKYNTELCGYEPMCFGDIESVHILGDTFNNPELLDKCYNK